MKAINLQKGFTLLELLVVIAIIGLLSSILMASVVSAKNKAKDAALLQSIKQFQLAMEMYKNDNGFYPLQDKKGCGSRGGYCIQEGDNGFNDFRTIFSPLLVPKYIPTIDFLYNILPDNSVHYYYSNLDFIYPTHPTWTMCGNQFYSNDEYLLAIYKYDKNGRKINLPLETFGGSGGVYNIALSRSVNPEVKCNFCC